VNIIFANSVMITKAGSKVFFHSIVTVLVVAAVIVVVVVVVVKVN